MLAAVRAAAGRARRGALAGVAFALSPAAGSWRCSSRRSRSARRALVGRGGRVAAIAAGFGAYPAPVPADQADLARLAGLGALYLVAVLRYATTRR